MIAAHHFGMYLWEQLVLFGIGGAIGLIVVICVVKFDN